MKNGGVLMINLQSFTSVREALNASHLTQFFGLSLIMTSTYLMFMLFPMINSAYLFYPEAQAIIDNGFILNKVLNYSIFSVVIFVIFLAVYKKTKNKNVIKDFVNVGATSIWLIFCLTSFSGIGVHQCVAIFAITSVLIIAGRLFFGGVDRPSLIKMILSHILISVVFFPTALTAFFYAKSDVLNKQNYDIKQVGKAPLYDLSVSNGLSKCPLFIANKDNMSREKNICWYDNFAIDGELSNLEKYYISARHGSIVSMVWFLREVDPVNPQINISLIDEKMRIMYSSIRDRVSFVNRVSNAEIVSLNALEKLMGMYQNGYTDEEIIAVKESSAGLILTFVESIEIASKLKKDFGDFKSDENADFNESRLFEIEKNIIINDYFQIESYK